MEPPNPKNFMCFTVNFRKVADRSPSVPVMPLFEDLSLMKKFFGRPSKASSVNIRLMVWKPVATTVYSAPNFRPKMWVLYFWANLSTAKWRPPYFLVRFLICG